ncbi:uncharacterized protein LOC129746949 [Uranotaenia lowii]|uniref:uncharacterized protein LOC129746949 n=1 Tax=Uranotaenia lowii TaxID=190385 RepID=UPI00247960E1|nr:uncharacterized protein LOC129746949 [Uranotaenia lowii]
MLNNELRRKFSENNDYMEAPSTSTEWDAMNTNSCATNIETKNVIPILPSPKQEQFLAKPSTVVGSNVVISPKRSPNVTNLQQSFKDLGETIHSTKRLSNQMAEKLDCLNFQPKPSNRLENSIQELHRNELSYIESLAHGIVSFIPKMYNANIPESLRGQRNNIFGNIEEIYELHQDQFWLHLQRCYHDGSQVVDCILHFLETDKFECYVRYALGRRKANAIVLSNKTFFGSEQLDLDSFLLQPIQRLPRYELFLNKLMHETLQFGDDHYTIGHTSQIDKALAKLKELILLVDAAISLSDIVQCSSVFVDNATSSADLMLGPENDLPATLYLVPNSIKIPSRNYPIDLLAQGKFCHTCEIDIYDVNHLRVYGSRFYFFERLILFAEIKAQNYLLYRGHYFSDEIDCIESADKMTIKCTDRTVLNVIVKLKDQKPYRTFKEKLKQFCSKSTIPKQSIQKIPENGNPMFFSEDTNISTTNMRCSTLQHSLKDLQTRQTNFGLELKKQYDQYRQTLSFAQLSYIGQFVQSFEDMLLLHNHQMPLDFGRVSPDLASICDLFEKYVEADFPRTYFKYLKVYKSIPVDSSSLITSKKPFTLLCIVQLQVYEAFLKNVMNICMSSSIYTGLHRLICLRQNLEYFNGWVGQNCKLFELDEGLIHCGLILYGHKAHLKKPGKTHCKIFICEYAAVCIKLNENWSSGPTWLSVLFVDRYITNTKTPIVKSLRDSKAIKLEMNGLCYKVRFRTGELRDIFHSQYKQQHAASNSGATQQTVPPFKSIVFNY